MAERRITGPVNSPGRGADQATQAALEAETNENTYAPPDLIKHSPSAAKAWCEVDRSAGTPTLNSPSYNISSVADGIAASTTVNLGTDMSSDVYAVLVSPDDAGNLVANPSSAVAGSLTVHVETGAGADQDTTDFFLCAFGDQ